MIPLIRGISQVTLGFICIYMDIYVHIFVICVIYVTGRDRPIFFHQQYMQYDQNFISITLSIQGLVFENQAWLNLFFVLSFSDIH